MTTERTVLTFLADLEAMDTTVAQWCREQQFPAHIVYQVVSGRLIGRSGTARRVMRAMGLPMPPMKKRDVSQSTGNTSA